MVGTAETRSGERLRARRRQRMADEIELAALRLFAEHGVDAVTVDDIAASADISRRTFFRYFASKDDLLHGNPERQREVALEAVASAPQETTPHALVRRVLLALTADIEQRREALLLRRRIAEHAPNAMAQGQHRYSSLVDALIDAVATRTHTDPATSLRANVLVHAGLGAMQGAIRTWFASGTAGSLYDLAAEALDLIGLREQVED
ncbi:TetR family transcriptional regulator [Haloechinothrix salitolerans]|uniref:TetR family transcriptional regulator n=1 Tax=Haloechinothrix salitolerans TaxID=926830 RepID=A0ABW2BV57_9PSEU